MDGYLLVDKPVGLSSFGVVARVRRVLSQQAGRRIKVGHTGTLDPAASGLMILVIGSYCRRAAEFSKLDKVYDVTMRLGATSTTDDAEGEISEVADWQATLRGKDIDQAVMSFVGQIQQRPPIYSAIKVDGQRAYKLARRGEQPQMASRPVTIYEIRGLDIKLPEVRFTANVSSGTYIRSLVRDIGEALGCGAYLTALRRTSVGNFRLDDAMTLEQAMEGGVEDRRMKIDKKPYSP